MRFTDRVLPTILLAFGLGACGTTPSSQLYLLSADAAAPHEQTTVYNIHIGLGPIEFPAYLNRNQIVVMTSDNSMRTAEYHRWAEPLEGNFARVLLLNLHTALPGTEISTFPRLSSHQIDVQTRINVLRFDADKQNMARLNVHWELIDNKGNGLHPVQRGEYIKSAASDSYEALVQALSECVAEFSDELAETIKLLDADH